MLSQATPPTAPVVRPLFRRLTAILRPGSRFVVRGGSMLPTLRDGDILQVLPIRGTAGPDLRRGELVVARLPGAPQRAVVKRIVALPGEYIRPDGAGRITINDAPLPEPYLAAGAGAPPSDAAVHFPAWLCGDDEYFLLGDNRAGRASADGRRYGPTPAADIIGRVWFRWPRLALARNRNLDFDLRRPWRRPERASPDPIPAPVPMPAPFQE